MLRQSRVQIAKIDTVDVAERRKETMGKQRMIVTDDQVLIDMDLLFNAIREADGNWEQVEEEMQAYLESIQQMTYGQSGDDSDSDEDDSDD